MTTPVEGEVRPLPIDSQIVLQQAQSTIKSLVDAIVELVTNSDDSYRRLEEAGSEASGQIDVYVSRQKGGVCQLIQVSDSAEGMGWHELERAVTFAASASGFLEGRSVRGLFGRGLKEAIIGLGKGEVWAVKQGQESEVEIFLDGRMPKYKVTKKSRPIGDGPGAKVTVEVLSSRIRSPKFDILFRQLSNHFALRDIVQNPRRVVGLQVDDVDGSRTRQLAFERPGGELKVRSELSVEGFGQAVAEIYESPVKLDFVAGDPGSVAGILVKTKGAVLDSRLFGFEADEAAHYFWGWVDCPGIAVRLMEGDFGVLDPNRSGLDWRHQYCRSLDGQIKELLRPLVREKRRQLERGSPRKVKEEYRRKLNDICRLLNALAESELEDLPDWGRSGTEITTLVIRPEVGYAEPNQPRAFSIYVPERLLERPGLEHQVAIELADVKGNVKLLTGNAVALEPHRKYEGLLAGHVAVAGSSYGDHAFIIARLDLLEDMAEVKVQSPGQTRRRRLQGTNRGLFRDIDFDDTPEPIQRVSFTEGRVSVFLRFPPISTYLKPEGDGMDSPQGSLMLAELVAEAFCKEVVRRRIESVDPPPTTGGGAEIDHFNSRVNQQMLRCLGAIHEALVV